MKWVSKPTFLLYTGFINMDTFEEKLHQLVLPLCEGENLFLVDLTFLSGGGKRLVKITVDTKSGITLSQCQGLSKKISDVFFRKDVFDGEYRLEVSSPGANKPLEKDYEFIRSIGKELQVEYRDDDELKSIDGELIAFKDNIVTIQLKNEEIKIFRSNIDEAKIKLKW